MTGSYTVTVQASNGIQPGASAQYTMTTVNASSASVPAAPTVNPTDGTTVSGTAQAGSTVTVKDSNNNTLCPAVTADASTGSFSCTTNQTLPSGSVLSVTASNAAGTSPVTNVTVGDGIFDAAKSYWSLSAPSSTSVDTAPSYGVYIVPADANGNRMGGVASQLTVSAPGAIITQQGPTTTGGVYSANITSTKVGTFPVSVSYGSGASAQAIPFSTSGSAPTPNAVFTAGVAKPDAGNSSLTVTANAASANNADTQTATAVITDGYGNPIANASVNFSLQESSGAAFVVNGANAQLATVATDATGTAQVQLRASSGGTYHVIAQVGGVSVTGSPAVASFSSGVVNASASSWSLTAPANTSVDSSPSYTATIRLVTANGSPAAGMATNLSVTAPGATVSSPIIDNNNGSYTATITSTKAGSFPVAVSLGSGAAALAITAPSGAAADAVFTAGAPVAAKSSLTVTTNAAAANDTDTQTAQVALQDQFGNPVPGASVDFSLQESSGAGFVVNNADAATATVTSGAAGSATTSLRATTPGVYHVVAEVEGTAVSGSPAVTGFMSGAVNVAASSWTIAPQTPSSGTSVDNSPVYAVHVSLVGTDGNPVTGAAANLLIGTTAEATGTKPHVGSFVDNGDGGYTALITSNQVGSYPVTVSLGGGSGAQLISGPAGSAADAVFTAGAPDPGRFSSVTVTDGMALANDSDTQTATAVIDDQFGNPVPGASVVFSIQQSSGAAFVVNGADAPTATVTTDSTGTATIQVRATQSGGYGVVAQVNGNNVSGSGATAHFASGVPYAPASTWNLSAPADTDVTTAPQYQGGFTLLDVNNNRVGDALGDVTANGSGATVTLGYSSTSGVYYVTVTSTRAGVFPITLNLPTGQIGAPILAVFTSGPGAAVTASMSATTGTALANDSDTQNVGVHVWDQYNNPVSGTTVNFSFEESSGVAYVVDGVDQPTVTGTTGGGWTGWNVRATKPGTYHAVATIDGQAVPGSPIALTFASGTAVASNSSWSMTAPASTDVDNSPAYTLTISLKDANNIPVTGAASQISINGGGATVSPTITDNGDGTYTAIITNKSAGTYGVSVNVGNGSINETSGSPTSAVFAPGVPEVTNSHLTVSTGAAAANDQSTQTATVKVQDQYGNAVPNTPVAFSLQESSGAGFDLNGTDEPTATVSTDNNGNAQINLRATVAGSYHVIAELGSTPVNGSPAVTTFGTSTVNTAASAWSLAQPASTDVDNSPVYTVTIPLQDASNTPVSGVANNLFVTAPGATTVSSVSESTSNPGTYTATITSTAAGSFPVAVTFGTGSAALTIPEATGGAADAVFTAGAANAGHSSLSVTTGTASANDSDTQTATVKVQDQYGNPVSGASVAFSLQEASGAAFVVSGADAATATVPSDSTGTATVQVRASAAGTYHVVAEIGGAAVNSSGAAANFGGGGTVAPPVVGPASVSALAGTAVPGSQVTVTVVSSTGGFYTTGQQVCQVTADADTGAFSCSFSTQFVPGDVVSVTAAQGGVISDATDVTVGAGIAVATNSWWTMTPTGSVAAGDPNGYTLTVTLNDYSGFSGNSRVTVFPSDLTVTDASASETPLSNVISGLTVSSFTPTSTAGVFTASITSPTAGTSSVQVNIGGTAVPLNGGTDTVDFTSAAVLAPVVNPTSGSPITGSGQTQGDTITVTDTTTKTSVGTTTVGSGGTWTLTPETAPAIGDELSVTETNASGTASQATTVTVGAGVPDPAKSTVTVDSAANVVAGSGSHVVTATVQDYQGNLLSGQQVTFSAGSGVTSVGLALSGGTTGPGPVAGTTNASGQLSVTVTSTATAGVTYSVSASLGTTATSAGSAGYLGAANAVFVAASVTVPAPVITSPVSDTVTNKGTGTISGTGAAGDTITLLLDGSTPLVSGIAVTSTGSWSYTPPVAVPDGSYSLTAVQTDTAGNMSPASAAVSITVKSKADAAPAITSPVTGTVISNGAVSFTGTGSSGDTITVSDASGALTPTAVVTSSGAWSLTLATPLSDGSYSFTATQTDAAGNVSAASSAVAVVVNTVLPMAPTVTGASGAQVTGSAPANAWITVYAADGTTVLGQAFAASNGVFLVPISPTRANGAVIYVTATDHSTGLVSAQVKAAVVAIAPSTPVLNPTQGRLLTGTAPSGTTITVSVTTPATSTTPATTTVVGQALVGPSGDFTVTLDPAPAQGTSVSVTTTDASGNVSAAVTETVLRPIAASRVQGPDRYSTAAAAAAQMYPNGAATVLLARGTNYPDAISAAPAAAKLGAPILLSQTDTLTGATLSELNALHPSKVIVLGDTVSISQAAITQVNSVTSHPSVVRISGPDRYATNRALVNYVWGSTGASTAFVATGQNFTDAESASSAAAAAGDPLVLVNGNEASLDQPTAGLLSQLGVRTIHAVGSTTNLDAGVFSGLGGVGTTDRTAGTDPVSQAIAVAQAFFPKASSVYLATTDDFPDALVAGALAGKTGSPVLFTSDSLSSGVAAEVIALGAGQVYVMGDNTRITDTAYSSLETQLGIVG